MFGEEAMITGKTIVHTHPEIWGSDIRKVNRLPECEMRKACFKIHTYMTFCIVYYYITGNCIHIHFH